MNDQISEYMERWASGQICEVCGDITESRGQFECDECKAEREDDE